MSIIKNPPYRRIATEEAFLSHDVMTGYKRLLADNSFQDPGFPQPVGLLQRQPQPPRPVHLRRACRTWGQRASPTWMPPASTRQIIALTAPGVQAFDPATGSALAIDANDQLAEACASIPSATPAWWPSRRTTRPMP